MEGGMEAGKNTARADLPSAEKPVSLARACPKSLETLNECCAVLGEAALL